MLPFKKALLGGAGLAASFCLFQAGQATASAQSISADDWAAMIQAVQQTTPTAPELLPVTGAFYSAQFRFWPPMPTDVNQVPAWSLGDGIWLLADQNLDYDQIAADSALLSAGAGSPFSMMASSLVSSYSYGNPVYLTNLVVTFGSQPMAASMSMA